MRKNGVDDLLGLSSVGSSGEGVAFQSCDTGLAIAQLGLKFCNQVVVDQLASSSTFRTNGGLDFAAAAASASLPIPLPIGRRDISDIFIPF